MMPRQPVINVPGNILDDIACDPSFPRGYYAHDILYGRAALSGADLRGGARKWGSWYTSVRARVFAVAERYGVRVVYDSDHHGRKTLSL